MPPVWRAFCTSGAANEDGDSLRMTALGTDSLLINLESVELDGRGGFFVTGAGARPIYHVSADGEITALLERDVYSGDLEYIEIGRLLIVPSGETRSWLTRSSGLIDPGIRT